MIPVPLPLSRHFVRALPTVLVLPVLLTLPALLSLPDITFAQAANDPPDVGDESATEPPQRAPAFVHESAFEDYVPYEESEGPIWIDANRNVGEIGGWRTYARELFESGDDDGEAQ